MTDRELLELAAKAAGIDAEWAHDDEADYSATGEGMWLKGTRSPDNSKFWNPLTDDGDALRLAVKLKLDVCTDTEDGGYIEVYWLTNQGIAEVVEEPHGTDPFAATRRTIVRAAAEIARSMK